MHFHELWVTDSIHVHNSTTSVVTGLIAKNLNEIVIKECPYLQELEISKLQSLGSISIHKTALQSLSTILSHSVDVTGNLTIKEYRFQELSIGVRSIGGHITLSDNKLLEHVYFVGLGAINHPLISKGNPRLRYLQFPRFLITFDADVNPLAISFPDES
ncbi:hypothetical protein DSO57_1008759 [Entomophthora muscae]|uniref:Uncharacterized protein n=1 Tax=Entomophthora muscae TaxID=34485 RepID=A0ACC2UGW2_9FUNG|nr:hypothetical protein DSO57_1008759 [Entomophthora muscae]